MSWTASPIRQLRSAATRLTTPLLPDVYLSKINPLWSARELRGRVVTVIPETADAATLMIKPGWGWQFDHQPGQYVGIAVAVAVAGRFRWRSYSLTSVPAHHDGLITITVKAMPEGLLSEHLVRGLDPGTVVRLAAPQGQFRPARPTAPEAAVHHRRSGITPVLAMLRTMDRRDTMPDVVLTHSARDRDDMLFHEELHDLANGKPAFVLHEQFTRRDGRLTPTHGIARICPDWRERHAWACSPNTLLDEVATTWADAGLSDALHLERFSATFAGTETEGGTVRFSASGISTTVDGATTLMQAGEQAGILMPFGCRMGICHT